MPKRKTILDAMLTKPDGSAIRFYATEQANGRFNVAKTVYGPDGYYKAHQSGNCSDLDARQIGLLVERARGLGEFQIFSEVYL